MSRMNLLQIVSALLFCIGLLMIVPSFANPNLVPGTWTNLNAGVWGVDVQFDPNNRSVLYAVGDLSKSTDGGSTWTQLGGDMLNGTQRMRIDPNNSQHLYVTKGVVGTGFWESTDGGATWVTPAGFDSVTRIIGGYADVYFIDNDPTDFNHFLLTSHQCCDLNSGVLETFNGGRSFTIHPPVPGASGGGGFNAFFLYRPDLGIGNAQTWLFTVQPGAQQEGFYRTTNSGTSWTRVSTVPMIHGGTQLCYTKSGMIYAGAQNCAMRSSDNGATWEKIIMGAGYSWDRGYFGIGSDGNLLYTLADGGGKVRVSPVDDGVNWTDYNNQTFTAGANSFTFDSVNGILYASVREQGVWALKVPLSTRVGKGPLSLVRKNVSRRSIVALSKGGVLLKTQENRVCDVKGRTLQKGSSFATKIALPR